MKYVKQRSGSSVLRIWTLVVSIAVVLIALPQSMPFAAEIPALTGRIVDNAGLIDPETRNVILREIEEHEQRSSDQIVVATIESLEGEALEPFANRMFRSWGLGQAGQDNGVLLLVAKSDRKVRIEVGYGLEGTLTDLHSRLIIENTIVPAFRNGDFAGGIAAGVRDMILVLEGAGGELEDRLRHHQANEEWLSFLPVLFIGLAILFFVSIFAMVLLAPVFGRKIGPGKYRWLGMDVIVGGSGGNRGTSSHSAGGWSSGGGGFSGGGGSSGGGGASGGW